MSEPRLIYMYVHTVTYLYNNIIILYELYDQKQLDIIVIMHNNNVNYYRVIRIIVFNHPFLANHS